MIQVVLITDLFFMSCVSRLWQSCGLKVVATLQSKGGCGNPNYGHLEGSILKGRIV